MKKYGLFVVTALLIILSDQLTKYWIDTSMTLHDSIPVLQGFFNLTYVRNPGAAFGFLAQTSPAFRYTFFIGVNILAITLILFYLRKAATTEFRLILALACIMGGAVGNLIDWIWFGEVLDFLDFYIGTLHWPAFNVADSSISVGACLLVWELWKRGRQASV